MNFSRLLGQALRMTARDWRAGELRLLAAALVVAVAAVTSVGFLVDRIRLGLERDATQLLGADLVLSSDTPINAEISARARTAQLQVAETVTFPSMAISARMPTATLFGRQGRLTGLSVAGQLARGRCDRADRSSDARYSAAR